MYYRCPVCNGRGLVESEFGGGPPHAGFQTCPACKGKGMQFVPERSGTFRTRNKNRESSERTFESVASNESVSTASSYTKESI